MAWQNQVSNITKNLSELVSINPEQTILINNIIDDIRRVDAIFNNFLPCNLHPKHSCK